MSNNTQALNSVLTFAGVKGGNYSQLAAAADITRAAYLAITAGNTRNFDDTKAAIPKGLVIDKELTALNGNVKSFKYANNMQGIVLSALITAAAESRAYFESLKNNQGKLNKKLNTEDLQKGADYAAAVSADFVTACENGLKALKVTRDLASEKTKATKAEKATAAAVVAENAAIEAAKADEAAAANTLTITDFLQAIKGGDKKAIAMAQTIAAALENYQAVQSEKAAAAVNAKAAKAAKAEKSKAAIMQSIADNKADLQALAA